MPDQKATPQQTVPSPVTLRQTPARPHPRRRRVLGRSLVRSGMGEENGWYGSTQGRQRQIAPIWASAIA